MAHQDPWWQLADQLMRSDLGKRSLREGWARELYLQILQHGAPDDPPVTQKQVDHLIRADSTRADFFSRIDQSDHPLREPLLAFRKAEMSLERSLSEHYAALGRRSQRARE